MIFFLNIIQEKKNKIGSHGRIITYCAQFRYCICRFNRNAISDGKQKGRAFYFFFFAIAYTCISLIFARVYPVCVIAWRRLCATERTVLFFVSIEIGHRSVYIFVLPKMTDGDFWRCLFVWPYILSGPEQKKTKQVGSRIMVLLTPSNKSPPQQSRWKRL